MLGQYKGNNSALNGFCAVGSDYFASAQSNKDAIHFWAWHKVRAAAARAGCRRRRRLPQQPCSNTLPLEDHGIASWPRAPPMARVYRDTLPEHAALNLARSAPAHPREREGY